jgi:hypothetical protein
MRSWIRRLLLRIRFNRHHATRPGVLAVSPEELRLSRDQLVDDSIRPALVRAFRWDDVVRIVAFKRDVFAFDQICVAFDLADGTVAETDEGMSGFPDLVAGLPERFREMDRGWWSKVELPPFESRPTRVWSR